jgi:hypothetical protein
MENSRIDAVGLLLAVVAVTLSFSATQMNFGYLSSLFGVTLLLVVLAFDRQGYRSASQSLAFAAVCGACLTLAAGYVLHIVSSSSDPKLDHAAFELWLSIAWLVGTLVFWGIDRARMSGREQSVSGVPVPIARTTGQGFIAQAAPSFTAQPAAAPSPTQAPAPVSPAPPPPPQPVPQQPVAAVPAYTPPPPLIEPIELEPVASPPTPPVTPAAPPPVHQIPPGKEAMIYVNLLGEGMSVLRTVRAENLGRDFYLIADEMPEGENWEFKPGQIVRCKKKNLSSGKGWVAFEEAPRAN